MKRLVLILAVCAGLALAATTVKADSPYRLANNDHQASVQLVGYGHGGHHGGHHGGWYGGYYPGWYYPRAYTYYRPYPYAYYPAYPYAYPAYPYSYSGISVYGPRVGVSIGF